MNKLLYKIPIAFPFILEYIFILLLIETNEESTISLHFPTSFELINNDIVIVAKDGIHFYNQSLVEYSEKRVSFSLLNSVEQIEKISIAQFPNENDGQILILVMDILYVFNKEGTEHKMVNLTQNINGAHYGLAPYKKEEDNKIIFIMSYIESSKIIIKKCEFNLVTDQIDITNIIDKNLNYANLKGIYCIFMKKSKSDSNEILTCFYASYPGQIFTISLSPEDNFMELDELNYNITCDSINDGPLYINAETNEDKIKALIYIIFNGNSYWMTFDFVNKFTKEKKEKANEISFKIYHHKILYFQQKKEFVTASYLNGCKFFIMAFNFEFNLEYKGSFSIDNCYADSFALFYDGNNYTIIGGNSESTSDESKYKSFSEGFNIIESYNIEEPTQTTKPSNSENQVVSGDNKCEEANEESKKYNLCTKCNKHYFPAEFKNNSFLHGFLECYNETTKPINFYLDTNYSKYKPCFEACRTCSQGGNVETNNCIECDINYIKKPGYPDTPSTNCVAKCFYSYYYTPYGQYKCTNTSNCPPEAPLYVVGESKCTDDCNKEQGHIFQYGGQCHNSCPINTKNDSNNICIDNQDNNSCAKSEAQIDLREFLHNGGIELNAKNYATEFSYTTKHVSLLYNDIYSIIIYKDGNCINELHINMPKIDFGSCYTKVQKNISDTTSDKIVIVLIERFNAQKKSTISYAFYHPITGEKIDAETICKEEVVVIKENVISQLNSSGIDLPSILSLTEQNINVFNLSDEFYTDICYCFKSPNGKDIPLKDRIKNFYPNITLCEDGCFSKGVNLDTMESICECKFNDLIRNDIIENNALLSNTIGEVTELIGDSNLNVLKCYKNVFDKKLVRKGTGAFIILGITFVEIILSLIFIIYDMNMIRKYLFDLAHYYIFLISEKNKGTKNKISNIIKNTRLLTANIKAPPKKILKKGKTLNNLKLSIKYNDQQSLNLQKSESDGKFLRFSSSKRLKKMKSKKLLKFKLDNDKKIEDTLNAKKFGDHIDIEEYLKPDLDDLEYDDAIKYDKRTFFVFLSDRLKEKQIFMDTFFNRENLRPFSIKVILLLLNIDLYFVINGLFYNEKYISELFYSTEEETFFSFFPRSISRFFYATLVGLIIGIIIDWFFVEEKKIKRILIREKEDPMQLKYEISLNVTNIKKRYNAFIFICFFISLISWYYISCFNSSYPGVKIEWIKSSITIIIIMQILSIIVILLEAILRTISFKYESEKIFKLKQLLS